jgi:hypothetical protein
MTTPIGTFHVTRPAWYGEQQLKVVLHADHLASHEFDEDKERELFEAEFKRHKLDRQDDYGFYVELYVETLWQGWLRCAKSRAKRFGGGA